MELWTYCTTCFSMAELVPHLCARHWCSSYSWEPWSIDFSVCCYLKLLLEVTTCTCSMMFKKIANFINFTQNVNLKTFQKSDESHKQSLEAVERSRDSVSHSASNEHWLLVWLTVWFWLWLTHWLSDWLFSYWMTVVWLTIFVWLTDKYYMYKLLKMPKDIGKCRICFYATLIINCCVWWAYNSWKQAVRRAESFVILWYLWLPEKYCDKTTFEAYSGLFTRIWGQLWDSFSETIPNY